MEKFEEGNKVGGQNAPGRVSSVKWNSMGVAVEFFREASKSVLYTNIRLYLGLNIGTKYNVGLIFLKIPILFNIIIPKIS